MTTTFNADELAKFFRWLEANAGIDCLTKEATHLCRILKEGKTIAVFDMTSPGEEGTYPRIRVL